jgi:hypothetical protein
LWLPVILEPVVVRFSTDRVTGLTTREMSHTEKACEVRCEVDPYWKDKSGARYSLPPGNV